MVSVTLQWRYAFRRKKKKTRTLIVAGPLPSPVAAAAATELMLSSASNSRPSLKSCQQLLRSISSTSRKNATMRRTFEC